MASAFHGRSFYINNISSRLGPCKACGYAHLVIFHLFFGQEFRGAEKSTQSQQPATIMAWRLNVAAKERGPVRDVKLGMTSWRA